MTSDLGLKAEFGAAFSLATFVSATSEFGPSRHAKGDTAMSGVEGLTDVPVEGAYV